MVTFPESNLKVGPPSWSPDNRFVYGADSAGHLVRYDLQTSRPDGLAESQVLPFDGESPAPLPTEAEKLVFVRAQPRPKLDVPGKRPSLDLTEVVVGDLNTREVGVLVPAGPWGWRHLSVSPDGKRLALVSDRGHEGNRSQHLRVFVLDLAGGDPKPLSPPASQAGPICWTADSQALVYARSRDPAPPDYWEAEPAGPNGPLDLYEYDLATNRENRLSRGGGCYSPSTSSNGDLYYLALQDAGPDLLLRRLPLAAAREFAAREPEGIVRDAPAWTSLLDNVLEDSKVSAKLDGAALTSEVVPRLAEAFNRLYRKHFQVDPPSTLKEFGRQRRQLQKLNLSPAVHPALTLILGALEGDHLVRRQTSG
jgi:dipeptidyl aminopeptidase/acylaminoacyl peptidase